MMPSPPFRAAIAIALATPMLTSPASAQISVFDPINYAQNLLTAARALSQINNQIQSLQNEAAMLANMAKNMKPGEFPQFEALKARLAQIDALMDRAQGISFRVDQLDAQFERLFPRVGVDALDTDARVAGARARLETAMQAYQQAMRVQAQVVENVRADMDSLAAISQRSQDARGALEVSQAGNQLLALLAKQQLQLQSLTAAQYRAEAIEAARRARAQAEARAATRQFLGSGTAYTAPPPGGD